MFSTLPNANLNFLFSFILLSANAFSLVTCKMLSFGKELMHYGSISYTVLLTDDFVTNLFKPFPNNNF